MSFLALLYRTQKPKRLYSLFVALTILEIGTLMGLLVLEYFQQTGWGNLLLLESLFFKLSINMALFVITIRRRCLRLLVKVVMLASLGTLSAVRWLNI